MTASLRLAQGKRPRVLRGHPWVFLNELAETPPADLDGGTAELRDIHGRFLGRGIVNGRSQIAWRRYTRERVELDAAWIHAALHAALERREPAAQRRLVWSESDALPGLVVDQYGDVLCIQVMTLAFERKRAELASALRELVGPASLVWRDDAPVRALEGLEVRPPSAEGGVPCPPRWLVSGGLQFEFDPLGGQKTGAYLDQRLEHTAVAAFAPGRRVLDAFCYHGGFSLHAARAGAASVLGLDSSGDAVARARANAARNRLPARFEEANVFDWFHAHPGERFDLIVLDPPPFARSQRSMDSALRGYKELNLRALQRLDSGGILVTYTCSHHVGHDTLLAVVGEAAHDTRRHVSVLQFRHQPPDHPVLPGMPESEYLRGLVLRVE